MEPEKLIGKKVKGFKFEGILYDSQMDDYIGKIGIIKPWDEVNFKVDFGDDFWYYPADQIEAHLVEDEIPTLSDGVLMLVSDNKKTWDKKEVWFKDKEYYYAKTGKTTFTPWAYAKPLEPTKEEQLTSILGSSDKVSEIMELFKN